MTESRTIVLLGSPRKLGNSTLLARKAVEGIEAGSGKYKLHALHEMDIQPCRACDSCRKSAARKCKIRDDMQLLYPELQDAASLLIASPIYWFSLSAQTKAFLDRCYALDRPEGHAFAGKRVGIILTYADADPYASGAVNAIRSLQDTFRYTKSEIVGIVYGSADKEGEISRNKRLLKQAFDLGRELAG